LGHRCESTGCFRSEPVHSEESEKSSFPGNVRNAANVACGAVWAEEGTQPGERWGMGLSVGKTGHKLSAVQDQDASSIASGGTADNPETPNWLRGFNASMDQLAAKLSENFHSRVANRTGLKGEFDFTVDYADVDSLQAAVQRQLGLRLVNAKLPVERIVIDRVEKPSAN
jgi:uncharacterized protein (TIGR03435 family)